MTQVTSARVMAGVPSLNAALYRRIRFLVGDPVAVVEVTSASQPTRSTLILRDIEMERARAKARVDQVACPADFAPGDWIVGDRETATAQAVAECLRRSGATTVIADRTLPLIFAEMIQRVGIEVRCDLEWGVLERRQKDAEEIAHIERAQSVTEQVMRRACETVANASTDADGRLSVDGTVLTSQRMRP